MKELEIGTRIYNHGDMANVPKFGKIVDIKKDRFGNKYVVRYDDSETLHDIDFCMFSEEYKGTGSTRFVTEEAHNNFRTKTLQQMEEFLRSRIKQIH